MTKEEQFVVPPDAGRVLAGLRKGLVGAKLMFRAHSALIRARLHASKRAMSASPLPIYRNLSTLSTRIRHVNTLTI